MREKKYYLEIDDHEYSVVINSLNGLRNKLIAAGKYTDAVDELIVEFVKHQLRNSKSKGRRIKFMEKTIFEQMGGTYTLQGDYYLPNPALPAEENKCFLGW